MKKALSLLLAVLMLVSLFSGMAFADDDVIVEEPVAEEVAEEPVVEEPVVEEDSFEAADAFAEEYTEEGSFEAADAWTPADVYRLVFDGTGEHKIDRVESIDGEVLGDSWKAMPTIHGTEFYVYMADKLGENPDGTAIWGDPVKRAAVVPHIWGESKLVPEGEASCTEGGYYHYETCCLGYPENAEEYVKYLNDPDNYPKDKLNGKCDGIIVGPSEYLPMQEHEWVKDETYTWKDDPYSDLAKDDRAVIDPPTCVADGTGNWVCARCGIYAWDKIYVTVGTKTDLVPPTYKIQRRTVDGKVYTGDKGQELDPRYHDFGSWTVINPASCEKNGTKAHYCNICRFQQTEDIPAYHHYLGEPDPATATDLWKDLTDPYSAMVFDHIERVDCYHYVEVWTCCLDDDCKGGLNGKAPFSVFVGVSTGTDLKRIVLDENGNKTAALDVKTVNPDECFLYSKSYAKIGDNNTEHYDHHRYSTEWKLATPSDAPKCMVEGKLTRTCTECDHEDYKPTPALEPIYGPILRTARYWIEDDGTVTPASPTDIDDGTMVYVHFLTCTRDECIDAGAEDYVPEFGKIEGLEPTDDGYFTQDNVVDPDVAPALALGVLVDHDWGEWTVYVAPTATTLGHWTRTCMYPGCHQVEEFVGTQEEFDEMVNPPYPVLKTGIYHEGEGLWKLYEMGIFAEDFTGIYDGFCDGKAGLWYVVDGLWQFSENGATLVGDTWYFLAGGKVQEVTQLAEYEGEWFLVEKGVIDTTKSALVEYNGGKFVVAAGRIVSEYDGLWQNAKSIGGNDEWYYVADGKVQTDYTGLVQYDGEWFYVENGQLVPYNGQVEYDGGIFNVRDGMVVSQVA